MSKVKILTLTPIHIGNGNFLHNNTDFVTVNYNNGDKDICVIDPNAILEIIGVEKLNYWINVIENKDDIKAFVARVGNGAKPHDYALRTIACYPKEINKRDTLKECIHDGFGVPYIPGSSIKGAMRTAILASMVEQEHGLESLVVLTDPRNGRRSVSATEVEKKLLGEDPNSDIFRFLKIGDAYFEKGCECAMRLINLNIREQDNLIDKRKAQLVEAIDANYSSTSMMKIDTDYYKFCLTNGGAIREMPIQLDSLSSLFKLINNHTIKLLKEELEYWKEVSKEYNGAEGYIEAINDIIGLAKDCNSGSECVLRLGHASGWRFMTGAWPEKLANFDSVIVPAARPNNDHYNQYDFPKSRRIEEGEEEGPEGLFGFIKLSL